MSQLVISWRYCVAAFHLAFLSAMHVHGAVYTDANGLAELEMRQSPSPVDGFVAAQFFIRPLDAARVVSSIDASTNGRGFAAGSLRQVNPQGLPTVFADYNAFMSPGDRVLGDSQFTFVSSQLIIAPETQHESSAALKATFTGFTPIAADSPVVPIAQLVLPWAATGTFNGAFAVRPAGGGAPQLAEFSGVPFGLGRAPADFNANGAVDGGDFIAWQRSAGATGLEPFAAGDANGDGASDAKDLAIWASEFNADPGAGPANLSIPEPATLALLLPAASFYFLRGPGAKRPR